MLIIHRKLGASQIQAYIFYSSLCTYNKSILLSYCNRDCFKKQLWVTGSPRNHPDLSDVAINVLSIYLTRH